LKINAIELMPVMEFEGNESWGYNTSFHMALDKFYGTSDKLKSLLICAIKTIAVILMWL
jgi:1,4-alpha-glucan branching enzyme